MFYERLGGVPAHPGVAFGAYHFMTWCSLASEQAAWFVANVPNDYDCAAAGAGTLSGTMRSSCKQQAWIAQEILEKVRVMLAAMERHTGKVPVIYTDMTFHRDILEGEQFDNPFWLRSTAAEPHHPLPRPLPYLIWQWTQTGTMSGINAEVDRNALDRHA